MLGKEEARIMAELYIFISYRREDAAGHAGRLYDRLVEHFGEANVFFDLSAIPGAADFTEEFRHGLALANAVLVVIGRHWLGPAQEGHRPRIHEPTDLVRAEVRAALESNVLVVPVLVGGARMPTGGELPHDISNLDTVNAIEVLDRRFSADVDNLIQMIACLQHTAVSPLSPPRSTRGTGRFAGPTMGCRPYQY